MSPRVPIVVIGVGQSLRGDDAAGLEAVRLWQRTHAATAGLPGIRVALVEQPGLELLAQLDGMDAAVLVDAAQLGLAAGGIQRIGVDKLARVGRAAGSVHGWGVAEALQMDTLLNPKPGDRRIRIVGIEPHTWKVGTGLSAIVKRALPEACRAIEEEVLGLLGS